MLGIDAALDGMSLHLYLLLGEMQGLAGGYADLPLDQVNTGNPLGYRMFYLNTRVHFQEIKGFIRVDEKLDRTGSNIIHGSGCCQAGFADGLSGLRVQEGAGGLLEHFLVVALHGTFALEQVHQCAVIITQHLYLDMAGNLEKLFDENGLIAKCSSGLRFAHGKGVGKRCLRVDHLHATAAATGCRFENDWESCLFGNALGFFDIIHGTIRAWNQWDTSLCHLLLGRDLVTHDAHRFR